MSNLELEITLKPSPWDNYPAIPYETWCTFTFIHRNEGESTFTVILAHEWDFMPYFEWFTENMEALRHEQFEILGINETHPTDGESLAQAINRALSKDFEDENLEYDYSDAFYHYRRRHNLKMASRGAAIPSIIIGMNHGHGEISLDEEKATWVYAFDMEVFLERLLATFKNALSQWRDSTVNTEAHAFISTLENQLEK